MAVMGGAADITGVVDTAVIMVGAGVIVAMGAGDITTESKIVCEGHLDAPLAQGLRLGFS
jgi:hypothetical protein